MESNHSSITRGYGVDSDGKRQCYECCGEADRRGMRQTGRVTLYLIKDGYRWHVSNWPGSLKLAARGVTVGRHNIARTRLDAWFTFEGDTWHAIQYGENTQIAHCKRIKSS